MAGLSRFTNTPDRIRTCRPRFRRQYLVLHPNPYNDCTSEDREFALVGKSRHIAPFHDMKQADSKPTLHDLSARACGRGWWPERSGPINPPISTDYLLPPSQTGTGGKIERSSMAYTDLQKRLTPLLPAVLEGRNCVSTETAVDASGCIA